MAIVIGSSASVLTSSMTSSTLAEKILAPVGMLTGPKRRATTCSWTWSDISSRSLESKYIVPSETFSSAVSSAPAKPLISPEKPEVSSVTRLQPTAHGVSHWSAEVQSEHVPAAPHSQAHCLPRSHWESQVSRQAPASWPASEAWQPYVQAQASACWSSFG